MIGRIGETVISYVVMSVENFIYDKYTACLGHHHASTRQSGSNGHTDHSGTAVRSPSELYGQDETRGDQHC